jgi:peptidoglycan/xylan/chitin deacetylase (PgdA/CDA1 family)
MCRLLGKPVSATWVVLYYHSIPSEKRSAFARQMDVLIHRTSPLRADARLSDSAVGRYASVTFDDAYQNVLENALPELAKRKIPATLFMVSDCLGRTPSWEDYSPSGDPAMNEPLLTEDQLRKMPADVIQIGSHTRTHPALPQLSEPEARKELSESRARLQDILGMDVKLFSFPYGAFNEDLIEWCRDAGYEKVFTTVPRPVALHANEFAVGRVTVDPDDSTLEFSLKLSGAYRWRPYAVALKQKFVPVRRAQAYEKGSALLH